MSLRHSFFAIASLLGALSLTTSLTATECTVTSPDGQLELLISDEGGLHFRLQQAGELLLTDSPLGLDFAHQISVGPSARIAETTRRQHDGSWTQNFGIRRHIVDRWNELHIHLKNDLPDSAMTPPTVGLIARAYDDGVAIRYTVSPPAGSHEFTLESERTEIHFPDDFRCWLGGESTCAEVTYPATTLSAIPVLSGDTRWQGKPYRGVQPLLVETAKGYLLIAETDLSDWAGMFLSGTGKPAVTLTLAERHDGAAAVIGKGARLSPWRALQVAHSAADLVSSDFLTNLAAPSKIRDTRWIQPGISAWDAWWTGENPSLPQFTGLDARGDTRSHKEYIDFAASMGWPYQLVDWFWYENMSSYTRNLLSPLSSPSGDLQRSVPTIDLRALLAHAKRKKVRLWIWAHSHDIRSFGIEKTMAHFEQLGFAGIKVDFIDSESQEAVQWCEELLASAARHHLMVDLHGIFQPVGWARTWPHFLTQEGVLGNEYSKLPGNRCDAQHTITLPFTRGILGPMDFTPGGFINRTAEEFQVTHPAQVIGTRARQLAMTVINSSPLLVLCDSPRNYRDQPGIEFFRDLPTVWDETVVLEAEVGQHLVLARRSGKRWWLAAMNGEQGSSFQLHLDRLDPQVQNWSLKEFADAVPPSPSAAPSSESPSSPQEIIETTRTWNSAQPLPIHLSPAGGYTAILSAR